METIQQFRNTQPARRTRMAQWFFLSVALYAIVLIKPYEGWPLLVTAALTKGANVNAGAFVGYWVDRTLFNLYDRAYGSNPTAYVPLEKATRMFSRAVVVGCCILGFSSGVGA